MSWYWRWYDRAQELERQNNRLYNEKIALQRRVGSLVSENILLSNAKDELEEQLGEKRRAALVSLRKVSTLEYKVQEMEDQNTKLSSELVKQREDMRKAGLLFMNAADTYQQLAKKEIRTKEEELANTRKAGLLLINAADTYQELARKQIKAKVEDLEDARKAVLVIMNAADTYQQVAEKKIKDKMEELRLLGVQKAEMDARVASLESGLKEALAKNQELEAECDKVKIENNKLWFEVERLMMELSAVPHKKGAAANAFDAEKAETMKELEDHEMKVKEIPTRGEGSMQIHEGNMIACKIMKESEDLKGEVKEIQTVDFMKGENDKLWSEVTAEQKHSLSEAEVERLKETI